jgi:TonB family protein
MPVVTASAERPAPADAPRPPATPAVDADRAFDALARAQLLRLSKGDGGGLAGAGAGGDGVGVGLSTALSGRYVEHSPVVTAPVIIEGRPVDCELPDILRLRAVVQVLVTRDGAPAVPRLLRSSGHDGFDRCALRYVLGMRFAPGANGRAQPWTCG